MIKTTVIGLFISTSALALPLQNHIFKSLKDPSQTIDLKTEKFKKAFFIAHDCGACHDLIKELTEDCTKLSITTFAVGNKKNLKSKLKMLKKLKSKVYIGSTTQAYADIGIDLMPYYISSTGKKAESDVYNTIMTDGVCHKKSKKKK